MATTYQLWDNASNNLIEDYYTEREALDYVREEIDAYGREAVASWTLLRDDGQGSITLVADGEKLTAYVEHVREAHVPITGE